MKIAVYTCIVGERDYPRPFPKEEGIDYFCYIDSIAETSFKNGWKLLPVKKLLPSKRLTNRYHKIQPHLLSELKEYDYTIYMDGNVEPKTKLLDLVESLEKDKKIIGLLRHWVRDCAYDEASICLRDRLDSDENIKNIVNLLETNEYPKHYGLCAGGFIIRKNSHINENLSKMWYRYVSSICIRDQISLNFCMWKLGIEPYTFNKIDVCNVVRHHGGVQREN